MRTMAEDNVAKAEVLRRIRHALRDNPITPVQVSRDYIQEGENAPGSDPVIDVFVKALEDYNAHVQITDEKGVPAAIQKALEGVATAVIPRGLPQEWRAGLDAVTVTVEQPEAPLTNHQLDQIDAVVTASRCAVSHTGTIMLDGTEDQGRRALTLVPDTHVVVVRGDHVFPTVPQAVKLLGEHPTRPTTWVAGPSATSDIELIRVNGVHGPRNLHVVIVR
ncbi:LutC/YkgG family protein [Gleimia hominis]|uniref:LutC/YkgG family protein n=1 Tax=Gleimia hominis TaxID=595468 RepID=UPI000C800633|nr:LUD domain-containing protein [Gleimia hominis]WIK64109.1 LUD domain-containing protein [Gleimia hominis]